MRLTARFAFCFVLVCQPLPAQQLITLPAQDRILTEQPVRLFSIGDADGADWEVLSRVRSAAFDALDNLFVLDGQGTSKPRVLVFNSSGQFVRQFGRRGSGPGEFQSPRDVFVLASGDIVVSDPGNSAYILFSSSGEHRRNVRFEPDFRPGQNAPGTQVPQNDARDGVVAMTGRVPREGTASMTIFRQTLDGRGAPTTIFRFPVDPMRRFDVPATGNRPAVMVVRTPMYELDPVMGVLPDGTIALLNDHEYAVKLIDASGKHVRTLARPVKARKTTKQDRDDYHKRVGDDWLKTNPGRPVPTLPYELPFAEYISVLTGMLVEPNRIWVQRRQSDGSGRGPIDLLTASGRYIGTLPPQRLPVAVSASGRAAYFITDELGVEQVEVRQLPITWK